MCIYLSDNGEQCLKNAISKNINFCKIHVKGGCFNVIEGRTSYDNYIKLFNQNIEFSNIKYVCGPYKYYQFDIGDSKFTLFGENHRNVAYGDINNSLPFALYLKSLIQINPSIEFYLEYDFIDINRPTHRNFTRTLNIINLNLIYDTFSEWLQLKKIDSKFRAHYVDYRYVFPELNRFKLLEERIINNSKPSKHTIADTLSPSSYVSYIDKIIEFIHTDRKLQKEIKSSSISNEIELFINDSYIELIDMYIKLSPKQYIKLFDVQHRDVVLRTIKLFNIATSLVMDVYVLARMFKTQHMDSSKSRNKIFYGGLAHCDIYKTFITKYLRVNGIGSECKLGQCLDVSKIEYHWD